MNRRRFSFSLRMLLLLMTVVAVGSAAAPPLAAKYQKWQKARKQQQIVRELLQVTNSLTPFPDDKPFFYPTNEEWERLVQQRNGQSAPPPAIP